MHDNIYPIFSFLAHLPVTLNVPINFWLWLMFVVAPGLVFFVSVKRSRISHVARVICAIGLTYVLMNLVRHAKDAFERRDYLACQENSIHPDMSLEMYEECSHHVNIADGASLVFLLLFGWILAAFYVSIWEIIWRIRHRKEIKVMGKEYKGRWFSNMTMLLIFLPFIAFFTLLLISL